MSNWNPSNRTLKSINEKTLALVDHFDEYITRFNDAFSRDETFGGPSLYFHFQCIKQFSSVSVEAKLREERFFEYLYATLVSWGMHRMGNTATKLRSYYEFKTAIVSQRDILNDLSCYKIWQLDATTSPVVLGKASKLLDEMKISKSSSHLVANTKTLHHILPDLIPPIDRQHTLTYFGINTTLPSQKPASAIFEHLFPAFVCVATSLPTKLSQIVDLREENWHTSPTKVIDNALIGAMIQ